MNCTRARQRKRRNAKDKIDYQKLNEKTIDDEYPLSRIIEWFHQIDINKDHIQKIDFLTKNEQYEFKGMPFGF